MDKQLSAARLRAMLTQPGECESCPLTDSMLSGLLERYPCYELAAYHACIMLSQDCAMRMSDGTTAPSQSRYWLNLALSFRPNRSKTVARQDEACAEART